MLGTLAAVDLPRNIKLAADGGENCSALAAQQWKTALDVEADGLDKLLDGRFGGLLLLHCSSLDVELELLQGRNARLLTCRLLLLLVCVGHDVVHGVLHQHAAQDFALMVLGEQLHQLLLLGQQVVACPVLSHQFDQALERIPADRRTPTGGSHGCRTLRIDAPSDATPRCWCWFCCCWGQLLSKLRCFKKLSSTQKRYASVEKECLGVLLAIEHFRHYVEGSRFKVVTDARSLLWLFTIGVESGNSKLLRWALKIQSYDIELEYRKGKQNITADCLSRSLDTISVAQVDPEYQDLVKQITMDPQAYTDFRVVDGSVYKFVKNKGKVEDSRFCWKVYPPKSEREEILRKTHGTAHLGFEKTLATLRERYFWPLMNTETKRFCQDCLVCQTSKATNVNTTAPLKVQRKIAEYPWQFVTMDYVGPLPASGKGRSTCLLVLTDVFSKFVLVQPFRQATADSLVPFVENMLFCCSGFRKTPSYHPQINDSERAYRVITTAIRATIKKDHKDWANNIQTIANAIRNSVHDATKYTPYFVLFGRNMVSDGREYRCMRDTSIDSGSLNNAEREKLYADVKENLKKAFERHSKYYNLRSNAKCPQYTVNEKVLKKNTELSDKGKGYCAKLAPKYVPALVKRVVGEHCYELEDEKGKRLGVFNCKYLKKFHQPPSRSVD
ncbi:hypothetical protein quinque_013588 [Culex quinquefasciatus]